MHGDLEPEEDWFYNKPQPEHVNDLWDDMRRLNALYEELGWPEDDVLDFMRRSFGEDLDRIFVCAGAGGGSGAGGGRRGAAHSIAQAMHKGKRSRTWRGEGGERSWRTPAAVGICRPSWQGS